MTNTWDVIVVGCGPSGTTTARLLSEKGIRTLLLDKMSLPRYKTCGGGLVKRGFPLFDNQLNGVHAREIGNVIVNDFSISKTYIITRDYPVFMMVMRDEFDYYLTQKAKSTGTYIKDNSAVKRFEFSEGKIKVFTDNDSFCAKYLVGADGVNSIVAKLAGWKETRKIIPALEYEITVTNSEFITYMNCLRFDFGIIDDGYAWVFPKENHLSVGLLSMKYGYKSNINKKLEDYISLLGIRNIINIKKHGFSIPVSPRKDTFAMNNVLLAGDAAGLSDPITAEGISYAMLSGKLAADCITSFFDYPELVMKNYNIQINSTIISELKLAGIVAGMVYNYPALRRFVLRKYGKVFSELMLGIYCNQRTYSKLLLNPFNYIKLLKSYK